MMNLISTFIKKSKNRVLYEFNRLVLWKYLTFPLGKKIYILGTPEHGNIGDSAIVLSEKNFLQKHISIKRIKELTKFEYREDRRFIKKTINKKSLICCPGGGNLGNQWYDEELLRYELLSDFPDNKIIIFPQTVYFTNDDEGQKAFSLSCEKYNSKEDLTIVAREKQSYEFLLKHYEHNKILLTPDIVLSSTINDYNVSAQKRKGALLVFRDDPEKTLQDETKERIIDLLKYQNIIYRYTDTYSKTSLTKDTRLKRVQDKLVEFASSEIVITDRLHGMIFSAITETPCIVFSNYNYKIKGSYEWIKHLPYIKYIETIDNIEDVFQQLLAIKGCEFDNKPVLNKFNELSEIIKKYVD